jgi:nucleoid-associated protein YgaU
LADSEYLGAIQLVREGDDGGALAAFLRVIARHRNAANSHLHAGRIYLEKYGDPIYAIYHFREYLLQAENGSKTEVVKQLIDTAKKQFIRSLPGHHSELDTRVELIDIAHRLREENITLKQTLREMQERCRLLEARRDSGVRIMVPSAGPAIRKNIRHVVRAGDTLSRISQKYYGTPAQWKKIFEANQDDIPFPNALTVGQELIIP